MNLPPELPQGWSISDFPDPPIWRWLFGQDLLGYHTNQKMPGRWAFVAPLWMPSTGAAGVLAALWFVAHAGRRGRQLAGKCTGCGYDLSGLTGPCPECGKEREA
jgi:hypothetical protein